MCFCCRFHIESFNVDDLMSLIFPYHSTRIFVRVLQMMNLSDPANKWHWLHPLQGPGVPLSKLTLHNRCATDQSFLHFICKMTSDAVAVHSKYIMLKTYIQHSSYLYQHWNKLRNVTYATKRPQTKHHWTIGDIQTL